LNQPGGLAMDAAGNLYVGDSGNGVVRRIDPKSGKMTTFAGTDAHAKGNPPPELSDSCDENGDGCEAVQAVLRSPRNVAVDQGNNIYISDFQTDTIRRVNARSGKITTYAGSRSGWSDISLHNPEGIAFDAKGNLYIADRRNNAVRKVAPHVNSGGRTIMTTIAGAGPDSPGCGGDGGKATSAKLTLPQDVAVDSAGNIYIVDSGCRKVRMIRPDGIITTVMGTGSSPGAGASMSTNPVPALSVPLGKPVGVQVDSKDNLYISDADECVVWFYDATSRQARVIAGTGHAAPRCVARQKQAGNECPATQVKLNGPYRVALDSRGNIYVPEHGGGSPNTIQVLSPILH